MADEEEVWFPMQLRSREDGIIFIARDGYLVTLMFAHDHWAIMWTAMSGIEVGVTKGPWILEEQGMVSHAACVGHRSCITH